MSHVLRFVADLMIRQSVFIIVVLPYVARDRGRALRGAPLVSLTVLSNHEA